MEIFSTSKLMELWLTKDAFDKIRTILKSNYCETKESMFNALKNIDVIVNRTQTGIESIKHTKSITKKYGIQNNKEQPKLITNINKRFFYDQITYFTPWKLHTIIEEETYIDFILDDTENLLIQKNKSYFTLRYDKLDLKWNIEIINNLNKYHYQDLIDTQLLFDYLLKPENLEETEKSDSKYREEYTIKDFLEGVKLTALTDYDGHGYLMVDDIKFKTIICSIHFLKKAKKYEENNPKNNIRIYWYNK
ncbi:MAG: hypothetical protein ACOC3V_01820 [bacterium]